MFKVVLPFSPDAPTTVSPFVRCKGARQQTLAGVADRGRSTGVLPRADRELGGHRLRRLGVVDLRILDAHVHLTPDGAWYGTGLDASEARLLREMDQAGVERALLVPAPGAGGNGFVAEVCRRHPDRLAGLAMLDPEGGEGGEPLAERARRALEDLGAKGFKVHPRAQNLDPNDPRLAPLMETAAAWGVPVMFCTYLGACQVPLQRLTPLCYDQLAKRHPRTTIILAHAGVQRVLDAYFVAKANPNVYLEISHVLAYLQGTSAWQDLVWVCDKLDQRVIFGSDFPEVSLPAYTELVREALAARSSCDLAAVMGGNLARLVSGWGQ